MSPTWNSAVSRANAQARKQDFSGARDTLRAAVPENPAPGIWFRIARAELACRNPDGAEDALVAARAVGLAAPQALQLTAAIGMARGTYPEVVAAARKAIATGTAPPTAARIDIAAAAIETEAYDLAMAQVDAVLAKRSDHPNAVRLKYQALLRALEDDRVEPALAEAMFGPGCGPVHLVALRELHRLKRRDADRMARLIARAREHWSDHPDLEKHLARALPTTIPDAPVKASARRIDTIRSRFDQIVKLNPRFRDVARQVMSEVDDEMLTRDPVISAVEDDLTLSANTGAGHVVVYFHGLADLAIQTAAMDVYLNKAGANTIYLRDPERLLFCEGHARLGSDFESTAIALQELIDSFGPRHSLTLIGVSAGGFGAVLYGTRLKADRVLCFSSPFKIDRAFFRTIGERRARAILHRIETYVPEEQRHCRHLLEAMDPPMRVDVIYGATHSQDAAHAEVLRGAPGVTLYPLTGVRDHATITQIMQKGLFMDVLRGNMRRITALCDQSRVG